MYAYSVADLQPCVCVLYFVLVGSLLTRNQEMTGRVFLLRKREIRMIEDQIYVERSPFGVRFNMKV